MSRVSVIVPVYNCEQYLRECILSILGQSYPDLELILIDDGSTDKSGAICDEYAKKDPRVRVCHNKNAGVSAARNCGIQNSSGDYLMFVDGDDFIEEDMIQSMMDTAQRKGADCVICGIYFDLPHSSRPFPDRQYKKETDGVGAIREILRNYIATAGPVCKMFRSSCVKEHDFPLGLSFGEDSVAIIKMLLRTSRVVFDTQPFYHYNRRAQSITTGTFSGRDMDLITSYEKISRILEGKNLDEEVEFRMIWAHFTVYDKYLGDVGIRGEQGERLYGWFRENYIHILKNHYVGRNRKIALSAMMLHPVFYRMIIQRREKKRLTLMRKGKEVTEHEGT